MIKNGVSEDTAFALEPGMQLAWLVALGEADGGTFDWGTMTWKEQG